MSKRPSIAESIKAKAAKAETLQRDNVATLQGGSAIVGDVAMPEASEPEPTPSIDREDFERAMAASDPVSVPSEDDEVAPAEGKTQAKRNPILPHDSVYMHPNVRKALRQIALNEGVKLQVVLRAAIQDYLDSKGVHFINLESGKLAKSAKTKR